MEISNGVDVDASWTDVIAHRATGGAWSTINKTGLRVKSDKINGNTNSPLVSVAQRFMITLLDGEDELLQFDLSEVSNQAGWTLTDAGLNQAVLDLNNWISN